MTLQMPDMGGRRPMPTRIAKPPRDCQHAFPLGDGWVICPICSMEQRVPRQGRFQTREGDYIFICGKNRPVAGDASGGGCGQKFLFNPFIDKPSERTLDRPDGTDLLLDVIDPL